MTNAFIKGAKDFVPVESNTIQGTVETPGGIFSSGGTAEHSFVQVDGDTLADETGQRYRLAGAYAPEHAKVETTRRGVDITAGEWGGPETTAAMNSFLTAGGFNRMVDTGEEDQYGRKVVRMTNEKGQDATIEAYRAGILKPNQYATEEQVTAWEQGLAARELGKANPYQEIVDTLDQQMQSQQLADPATGLPIFAEMARDEAQYASGQGMGIHNMYSGVQWDDPDKDLRNVAQNSIGTSAYTGWVGLKEGVYGALDMFGLEAGQEGLARMEQVKEQLGIVENISIEEVDGIGDFFEYLGNNAAMSAPYLGLIAGSALVAPAGVIGAAVATVPTGMVYAGQTWNEMEGDKNAGAALAAGFAAATLDRLGLAGIVKPSQFLTASGKQKVVQALSAARGISNEAAEQVLKAEGKATATQMLRHMATTADGQVASYVQRGNLVKDVAKGALQGGVSEGLTEAGQETIQYATAVLASDREFNQFELEDRLFNALAAGTALGTGFGSAGQVIDYAGTDAEIRNLQKAQQDALNEIDQIRETLRTEGVILETTQEIRDRVRADVANWEPDQQALRELDIEARAAGKKRKKQSRIGSFSDRAFVHARDKKGFLNTIKEIESLPDAIATGIAGVAKLYQAAATTAFKPGDLANREYGQILRDIRALVGQTRGVINPGRSFEAQHDMTYSTIAQMVYTPEVLNKFGFRQQRLSSKNREAVSNLLYEYAKGGWYDKVKNGQPVGDMPAHLAKHAQALKESAETFELMADRIHNVQDVANKRDGGEGVSYTQGWWWKHRGFDPAKVTKNKKAWFDFMRKHTNLSEQELNEFYDRISGGDMDTIQDFFSHVRGIEYQPGQHKRREAKLSEQEGFEMFAQDDIFQTMDNAAKAAARYATNRDYFGAGGKNLDYLFDQLEAKGMPTDKVNEVAWYTKAIIDSQTGNFNRIQNYRWAAIQKVASTWAILAGLPLSTLSSIPETAMISLGLDKAEFATAISKAGKELSDVVSEGAVGLMQDAIEAGIDRPIDGTGRHIPKSQARLNEAGLLWTPASAGKRIGVGETNITQQWIQDEFFRAIGLTGITQAQRRASGAMTVDFVGNRLAELAAAGDLKNLTARQQHIYNQLAELGMEVDTMVELWKDFGQSNQDALLDYANDGRGVPADVMEIVDNNMKLAVYNFTNLRVQNPGAANRPLFFQDPHWQMLTQFNGFISTFTANVVPKLWNDYIKRGTPQVKYQTFALILTMAAMGAGSQYLKDWIKYGKSSPYLSNPQLLQRAIYSSGVLGQGERLVDIALPLYGNRPRSSVDWFLDTMVGEAGPTVRNIGTLYDVVGDTAGGDFEGAAQTAAKATPFIAPFGRFRKALAGLPFGTAQEQFNYYDDI